MKKKNKKTRKYGHIIKAERHELSILLRKGYSIADIAEELGRSPSSISEEISRNSVKGKYDAKKAHLKARQRRKESKYQAMKIVGNRELREYIEERVKRDWSPELISGRIKYVDKAIRYVSALGIYKYVYSVYGRRLEQHLWRKGKKVKNKGSRKVSDLKDRIFIDERPKIVENKGRYGDWEGDLIVSGKNGTGALLVLYERKSRYVIIKRLLSVSAEIINYYLKVMLGGMLVVESLTLDNDVVFKRHKEMSDLVGALVYFCHPYHSWEKGGVESVNGLIRRYVEKGSDISKYTEEYIMEIQDKLNNRPRKCLKFKTPNEIMKENNLFKEIKVLIKRRDKNMGIVFEYKKMPAFGLRA